MCYVWCVFVSVVNETGGESVTWERNCIKSNEQLLGCHEHKWRDSEIIVDECVCTEDLCNSKMSPIDVTTTTLPPEGN